MPSIIPLHDVKLGLIPNLFYIHADIKVDPSLEEVCPDCELNRMGKCIQSKTNTERVLRAFDTDSGNTKELPKPLCGLEIREAIEKLAGGAVQVKQIISALEG